MTQRNHLVEQHILEHEARLKHVDEVIEQSSDHLASDKSSAETSQLLESLKSDRDILDDHLTELKEQENMENAEAMIANISPLDIWNTVADKLEQLAERLDKK